MWVRKVRMAATLLFCYLTAVNDSRRRSSGAHPDTFQDAFRALSEYLCTDSVLQRRCTAGVLN